MSMPHLMSFTYHEINDKIGVKKLLFRSEISKTNIIKMTILCFIHNSHFSTGDMVQVVYRAGIDTTPLIESGVYYHGFTGFRI